MGIKLVEKNEAVKQEFAEPDFEIDDSSNQFAFAYEAIEIGEKLIEKFHSHLVGERVEFVFTSKTPTSGGREKWGSASKLGGLNAWLCDDERQNEVFPKPFFIIKLSWQIWKQLESEQKIALVDHYLAHCNFNEKGNPVLLLPDCKEFNQIMERHGAWNENIIRLLKAEKQSKSTPLFDDQ